MMIKIFLIYIVSVFIFSDCLDATKEIYICDHSTENRLPSVLDSVSAVFHSGGEKIKVSYDNFIFQNDASIPALLKQSIPIAHWFADGKYSFSFQNHSDIGISVEEVNLLQQDTKWSLTSAPFCLLQWSSWCTCATSSVSYLAKLHFEGHTPCVTKLSKSVPEYYVDPSRPSCVQLILSDDVLQANADNFGSFELRVPTADTLILRQLVSRLLRDIPEYSELIFAALNHVPLYLLSLVVGLYLTYNSSDIAEDRTFQVALQVFLGLCTALVVLIFVAHRIISGILSRHSSSAYMPRVIDSLFGFSVMSVAYQYRYFLMGQAFDMLLQFWDEGAFGYWWFGRVYFAFCIVLSLSVCHYFDLFRDPDSRSFFVALLACRALGWMFLLHSSSSTPVAWTITLTVIASSPLKSYFHYFYFMLAGYLQPKVGNANAIVTANKGIFSSPSARKLSKSESEALVRSATAKEMEKLRKFLKENPQELSKFDQTMREDGKESTANLVGQFAANLYSGRPRPPAVATQPSWLQRIFRAFRDIGVVLLLGCIVAMFTLNGDTVTHFVSKLLNESS